jgi:hypothetical protein
VVANTDNPDTAASLVSHIQVLFERAGAQPFAVAGVAGANGEQLTVHAGAPAGAQAHSLFGRGALFLQVVVARPSQSDADRVAVSLSRVAARRVAAGYAGSPSAPLTGSGALGALFGGLAAYMLLLTGWAYFRDPLVRERRRARPGASASPAPGSAVDVSRRSRQLRWTAAGVFCVQIVAGGVAVAAVLPAFGGARPTMAMAGLAVSGWAVWYRSRRVPGGRVAAWALEGPRPVRATALLLAANTSALLACLCLLHATVGAGEAPDTGPYVAAMGCLLALAGICLRRARRDAAVSAATALERDDRPPVLYLRSFGDDSLRLRSATLGRRSLIERFSPNRFDSFEEVIARHLSPIGPVIAVNPPGTKLPPLGAARQTLANEDWQAVVDDWMARSALIVIGAPPDHVRPGLLWELHHIDQTARWSKTLFVVPPVRRAQLDARWRDLAAAVPYWPSPADLGIDPGRVMLLARHGQRWTTITANGRTEWSYAAAIEAAAPEARHAFDRSTDGGEAPEALTAAPA